MRLVDFFEWLKRNGLVATHSGFSTDYLNMGPRYFDHLLCSGKPPAIRALVGLYVRLSVIAEGGGRSVSHFHGAELADVAQQVWLELQHRCCSLLPDRQHRPAPIRAIQHAQTHTR